MTATGLLYVAQGFYSPSFRRTGTLPPLPHIPSLLGLISRIYCLLPRLPPLSLPALLCQGHLAPRIF